MRHTLSILLLLAIARAPNMSAQSSAGSPLEYRNAQYGFCFSLPASWKGYSIITEQWEGAPPGSQSFTRGPKLLIRHPHWTEKDPYEDIPIMVFTHAQWQLVAKEELIVSAAPIGPSELGSNVRYVFALPPRYNFDLATGWQEVDNLIQHKSLRAPCASLTSSQ
jgi:hypothetical protein